MKKRILLTVLSAAVVLLIWQQYRLNSTQKERDAWKNDAEMLQTKHIGDSLLQTGDWAAARTHAQTIAPALRTAWLATVDTAEQAYLERQAADSTLRHQAASNNRQLVQTQQAENILRHEVSALRHSMRLLRDSAQARAMAYFQIAEQRDSLLREKTAIEAELAEQVQHLTEEVQSKSMLRFKSPAGVDILYFGRAVDGKPHGKGIGFYANGTNYEGDWDTGDKHGTGVYTYPNGERYEGTFVRNKRNGLGTYTWPNGDTYRGFWKDDMRNGEGAIKNDKEQILRSGLWENDKLVKGMGVDF